jgi:hypothetical protein
MEMPLMTKIVGFVAAAGMAAALAACGGNAKAYDIAPVFPLSADKCARYGGDQKGSGITASCMVTRSECVKAAADWRESMQNSGVNDAVDFSCE